MGTILTKLDPLVKKLNVFKKKKRKTVEKEGIPYSEIRDSLTSFTLVFFKGPDFVSSLIRHVEKLDASKINQYNLTVEKNAFSHVGFIVRPDILDDERLEPNGVYIFESTMSGSLGKGIYNIDGKPFLGMQLRDFDEVIQAYDANPKSQIAVASLNPKILDRLHSTDDLSETFTALFSRYEGVKYNWNAYSLLSSLLSCMRPGRETIEKIFETEEWMFCSEAVAQIYVELGILPENVKPKNVVPMDFLGYDDEGVMPNIIDKLINVVSDKL